MIAAVQKITSRVGGAVMSPRNMGFCFGANGTFCLFKFQKSYTAVGDFSLVNSWELAAGISSAVLTVSPIQLY